MKVCECLFFGESKKIVVATLECTRLLYISREKKEQVSTLCTKQIYLSTCIYLV